jgi:hypothetical protein
VAKAAMEERRRMPLIEGESIERVGAGVELFFKLLK